MNTTAALRAGVNEEPMTAVLQRGYGSAEVLSVGARARPRIGPREVLVEVHAAGMDRGTWHLMAGYPYAVRLATGLTTPRNPVPGLDLAGTVVEVGAQVTRFAPGDRVFGIGKGSYAQLAAAREDKLALMPQRLSFEQAAVVPVSGLTALQALRDSGRVAAGQRVLIIGASGGVGTYAVQLARAFGAHVTAVCSGAKAEKVRSLGAERVIDHAREDWADGSAKYDLILDIAGNAPLGRLRRAATREGTIVFVGGEGGGALTGMGRQLGALLRAPFISQRVRLKLPDENGADLEVLRGLIDEGKVTPAIDSTWRLEQVPEAMRRLVAGAVTGKLCISVAR